MTDEDGDEVARYAYDPYGGLVEMSGDPIATRNPLRYRGYYYDNETQLYYLPARYYNPDTARFLSVDPAPPSAGDPTSLNGYAYCVGDPVQLVDPTGATIDVDGDGSLDSEDSISQNAISTSSNSPFKAARMAGARAAVIIASKGGTGAEMATWAALERFAFNSAQLDDRLSTMAEQVMMQMPDEAWCIETRLNFFVIFDFGRTDYMVWHNGVNYKVDSRLGRGFGLGWQPVSFIVTNSKGHPRSVDRMTCTLSVGPAINLKDQADGMPTVTGTGGGSPDIGIEYAYYRW